MSTRNIIRPAIAAGAAALVAALVVACGGGGGGSDPTPSGPPVAMSEVPESATTSSAGALAFVKSLAASKDDTASPIVVGDAVLATSDTDEPDPSI